MTTTTFNATDESGDKFGRLVVRLDENGDVPPTVRDQHGTTWVFMRYELQVRGERGHFQRAACGEAWLDVKP